MSSNPFSNLAAEVGRNRNVAVAFVRLCSPNTILPSLTLLDGFVDSELCAFKIVNAQSESLAGTQPTHRKEPQHEMFPLRSRRKKSLDLVDAEKALARLFLDVRHSEFPSRVLGDEVFVDRVFEGRLQIRANVFDCRF